MKHINISGHEEQTGPEVESVFTVVGRTDSERAERRPRSQEVQELRSDYISHPISTEPLAVQVRVARL